MLRWGEGVGEFYSCVAVNREGLRDLGRRITPWEVAHLGSML